MNRNAATTASQANRREFVLAGAGLTAAGLAAIEAAVAQELDVALPAALPFIEPGQTILFQGDSITDAGRTKDDPLPNSPPALGTGYAWFAASQLLVDRPNDRLKIFNRGISGNKVYQLAERWQADCLDLRPDVLSILIGVNDIWHTKTHGYRGTLESYQNDYLALVEQTREALPDVTLVICEPFVLRAGVVDDSWFPAFDGYRAAARRVAETAGARFVPFQTMFDLALKVAPAERWAADGVHPTPSGAALMAHWWLKSVAA